MPLIRLIFPALLTVSALCCSLSTHAEELLALNSPINFISDISEVTTAAPEEVTAVAPEAEPEFLTSARNIKLELLPEAPIEPEPLISSPETPDLWSRIRDGFAMNELKSKRVSKYEKWYARHPDYVDRMTDRSRRYLHYIIEEVERRGMPAEIALLPMVESAFNPGAYSVSRASGIWQFIPSTGKVFGMEQNWWYDGRRDVINATNGALDYLQKLHGMFGDWELALAAYNCGEGAVKRAQSRNRRLGRSTKYTSLRLPRETRDYVPKLIAIKNIISNPEKFALSLPYIKDEPYFVAVATTGHMDVKLAAELADISEEEFIALNPAHNRPVILQDNTDLILLPIKSMEIFQANLESYDKPLVSWQPYQPKKGDRLDKLAPRFGMSVENLKRVNGIYRRGNISTGQTLLVPINDNENIAEFEAFNMHLAADDRGRTIRHRVRRGETLSHIARRYHVSVRQLRRWNKRTNIIRIGQIIKVKKPVSRMPTQPKNKSTKVF